MLDAYEAAAAEHERLLNQPASSVLAKKNKNQADASFVSKLTASSHAAFFKKKDFSYRLFLFWCQSCVVIAPREAFCFQRKLNVRAERKKPSQPQSDTDYRVYSRGSRHMTKTPPDSVSLMRDVTSERTVSPSVFVCLAAKN